MGYDSIIEDINNKIEGSSLVFVKGPYGTGKTTIMKGVISRFGGKRQVIYYNCNKSEKSIDYDTLLINAGGFIRRFFYIRKKDMILILDEAQDMNQKDIKQIKKYHDEGFLKSVIFVSSNDKLKLSKDVDDLLSGNKYVLGNITNKDAVKIVKSRIGDLDIISDTNIIMIFEKDKNPRSFLKNCEEVFRYAVDKDKDKIIQADIKKVLG
jgi:ABC-type cobalamin/Fe3+-siderophores transport system ATPase subunit